MAIALEVVLFVFQLLVALLCVLITSTLVGMQFDKRVNHNIALTVGGITLGVGLVCLLLWSAF